jgi:AGCS family alanine or glycine:cation symporter
MAYYYYAESNVAYLARNFKNHKLVFNVTRVLLLVMTFVGAINSTGAVWALGDVGVGLMAWLNLVAILLLTKVGVATLKDYEAQKKLGIDPVFNPEALGIKNADFWMRRLKNKK